MADYPGVPSVIDVLQGLTGVGSTCLDYSGTPPTVPISGFSILATIPSIPKRSFVEVQNQSAGIIQVVRDDGAGAQQTSILLTGTGSGAQGGSWTSSTYKGRVRIYGMAGSQFAAYQE